jgi:hypothetical protein
MSTSNNVLTISAFGLSVLSFCLFLALLPMLSSISTELSETTNLQRRVDSSNRSWPLLFAQLFRNQQNEVPPTSVEPLRTDGRVVISDTLDEETSVRTISPEEIRANHLVLSKYDIDLPEPSAFANMLSGEIISFILVNASAEESIEVGYSGKWKTNHIGLELEKSTGCAIIMRFTNSDEGELFRV